MNDVVQENGSSRGTKQVVGDVNQQGWPFAPSGAGNQSPPKLLAHQYKRKNTAGGRRLTCSARTSWPHSI
jgi:hypothetical protein